VYRNARDGGGGAGEQPFEKQSSAAFSAAGDRRGRRGREGRPRPRLPGPRPRPPGSRPGTRAEGLRAAGEAAKGKPGSFDPCSSTRMATGSSAATSCRSNAGMVDRLDTNGDGSWIRGACRIAGAFRVAAVGAEPCGSQQQPQDEPKGRPPARRCRGSGSPSAWASVSCSSTTPPGLAMLGIPSACGGHLARGPGGASASRRRADRELGATNIIIKASAHAGRPGGRGLSDRVR
jgi:hypothetical protein